MNFIKIIVVVFWIVFGLFMWVPLLFRVVIGFSFSIITHAVTSTPLSSIKQYTILKSAVSFYWGGFKRIREPATEEINSEIKTKQSSVLLHLFWAIFFWASFFAPLMFMNSCEKIDYNSTDNVAENLAVQHTYEVSDGSMFIGQWIRHSNEIGGDPWDISLNIEQNGLNYIVNLIGESKRNFNWIAAYKDQQLISNNLIEGKKPILKLLDETTIQLKNIYLYGANEHKMTLESRTSNKPIPVFDDQSVTEKTEDEAFYIINVTAVKNESLAERRVEELKHKGYDSDFLWIPDYASLSGAKYYTVYIGPFKSQYDCEVATEEYRKTQPDAYGLLVSHDNIRVEIRGIGKVKIK
ncbi:MAG: hypothetical protein GQ574_11825 [Crocinitomix sp.]|nr:hypothetical protein [Crocinitomix sp.]